LQKSVRQFQTNRSGRRVVAENADERLQPVKLIGLQHGISLIDDLPVQLRSLRLACQSQRLADAAAHKAVAAHDVFPVTVFDQRQLIAGAGAQSGNGFVARQFEKRSKRVGRLALAEQTPSDQTQESLAL